MRILGNRVLVKPSKGEEVSKGGIILPGAVQDKPNEGEVIATGVGRKTEEGKVIPMEVAVGDYVLYTGYAGTKIIVDEEEHLVLFENDILAIK